jgi:hypothetical protein
MTVTVAVAMFAVTAGVRMRARAMSVGVRDGARRKKMTGRRMGELN